MDRDASPTYQWLILADRYLPALDDLIQEIEWNASAGGYDWYASVETVAHAMYPRFRDGRPSELAMQYIRQALDDMETL